MAFYLTFILVHLRYLRQTAAGSAYICGIRQSISETKLACCLALAHLTDL